MTVIKSVADMEKFAKDFEVALARVAQDVLSRMVTEVKSRTPVDTSRLINNWQVSFGAMPTSEVTSAGEAFGGNPFKSSVLSGASSGVAYIANLVPYAYAVEFFGGSNWMAAGIPGKPAMMVRGALPFWGKFVEAAAAKVRL
jgi:hypothetical protein